MAVGFQRDNVLDVDERNESALKCLALLEDCTARAVGCASQWNVEQRRAFFAGWDAALAHVAETEAVARKARSEEP
jgi:hypothetical protein